MDKRKRDNVTKEKKKIGKVIKLILKLFVLVFLLTLVVGMIYFYNSYGKTIIRLQKESKNMVRSSSEDTFQIGRASCRERV